MSGLQKTNTSTLSALRHLRAHAIEAHCSGDGMQVLHHCTVALNRVIDNATTGGADRITLSSVRWAFFLGLYWLLDDWFLYVIKNASDSVATVEPGEDDQHDLSVVQYLFATLQTPLQYQSPTTLLALPPEYLASRATDAEDVGALSLAVELAWYQKPTSGEWNELVEKWAPHVPDDTLLHKQLIQLSSRLKAQTRLLLGAGAASTNEADSSDWPQEQQWLMKGWQLYQDCAFDALDLLLSELTPRLDAEGSYVPMFTLFHWSRMYRKEQEEQLLSLSRRNLVVSRQPASVFREVLGDRFAQPYSTLARKGFPDGAAHERLNAFRIAMLVQLHGLRSWDIGAWRMGEAHRAQACLELGARGDVNFAREGVMRAVRSNTVEDSGKYPHLDVCVQLLDALSEDQRAEVVTDMLASARNNWPSVHRVLKQLADAIPVQLLGAVAKWSARVELDEFHSRHAITYLDFWHIILQWAPNAQDIVAALLPALVKDASTPACWRFLHNEFISAVVKGSENVACDLVGRILDVSCEQRNWNEHRFSILYNVAKECPPLRETCIPWLQGYVQTGDDAEYQQYLLRNWGRSKEGPVDDSHFREWLRRSILAYCDRCLQEKGPSYSIGGAAYHRMIRDVTWPRGDRELVDRLVAVADAEYVPFVNKVDPIACLAYLAKAGTKTQSKRIAQAASRWLGEGIKGHDVGIGGPLSVGQVFGVGPDSVIHPLMLLVDVFAEQYPDVLGRRLATWVLTEGLRRPAGVVAEIVRIALNLSIYFQDEDSALSLALVGTAEAAAHSAFRSEATKAIAGFRSVAFPKVCHASTQKWRTSASGRLCMDMWARRLCEAAQLPNPSARQELALCIRDWHQTDTSFPEPLMHLEEHLRNDPRLRVRAALTQSEKQGEE